MGRERGSGGGEVRPSEEEGRPGQSRFACGERLQSSGIGSIDKKTDGRGFRENGMRIKTEGGLIQKVRRGGDSFKDLTR